MADSPAPPVPELVDVVFVGRHREVTTGCGVVCVRDVPTPVPAELAARLLAEQPAAFQTPTPTAPSAVKKNTPSTTGKEK